MNVDKLLTTHGLICFGFDGSIGMIAQQKAYDKLVEMIQHQLGQYGI